MSTLPSSEVEPAAEDSIEKQVYSLVDEFKENIPIANDRNRLGFNLYRFLSGIGDPPEVLVKSAKLGIVGITPEELAKNLSSRLTQIKN